MNEYTVVYIDRFSTDHSQAFATFEHCWGESAATVAKQIEDLHDYEVIVVFEGHLADSS